MSKLPDSHLISDWVQSFLFDRKVQGFTTGTVTNYRNKFKRFMAFCKQANIDSLEQITPNLLREYLESLDRDNLTIITRHGHYAALKTFLRWFEAEEDPPNWSNPIARLKPPKMPDAPIQPIPISDIMKIIAKCPSDLRGLRDKAIFLTLLDTGIRASELLQLDQSDLNLTHGSLLIRHGKGNKTRTVYIGKSTRKLIKRYLSMREDDSDALFVSVDDRARLSYSGLRWIVLNRSKAANVTPRGIHTFRRLYALTMLRNGVDVITLSRLMGHSDLSILRRYLAQTDDDLREAHAKASPVDSEDW